MRLPPKNGSGSSATRDRPVNGNNGSTNTSLHELVAKSFDTLEDNINDIIAFEEEAERKNVGYDRARQMVATPSERYMMPSPKPQGKTVMPSPSPVQEAKKRLSLSSDYSSSSRKSPLSKSKRLSFTSDSSWLKSAKASEDGEIIKPSSIRRISGTLQQSDVGDDDDNNRMKKKKQNPSSSKLFKKPSEWALKELKELSAKFESDMEITELRQELHRASIHYEILGKQAPFGINSSERSDTGLVAGGKRPSLTPSAAKRISFQKDLPHDFKEQDVHDAIKERLNFFRTSLQEYTEQQQHQQHNDVDAERQLHDLYSEQQPHHDVSESEATDDNSKDHHLSREINTKRTSTASVVSVPTERRLSDVTLDTAIVHSNGNHDNREQQDKRPSHVLVEDVHDNDDGNDDDKMRATEEAIDGNAGSSMQQMTPTKINKSVEQEKRKWGETLTRFFSFLKAWLKKRIDDLVAGFTPKEKMIVKQMG